MSDFYTVVLPLEDWRTLVNYAGTAIEDVEDEELKEELHESIKKVTRQLGWGPY